MIDEDGSPISILVEFCNSKLFNLALIPCRNLDVNNKIIVLFSCKDVQGCLAYIQICTTAIKPWKEGVMAI